MEMEMTLNINVQIKGHAAGTLGWFQDWLSRSELVIRKTRDGTPGMFLHETITEKGNVRDEHEGNTFICKPYTDNESCTYYEMKEINNVRYAYVVPYCPDRYDEPAISNYPLTPSCHVAVDKFIDDAVEKFAEWYEKQ